MTHRQTMGELLTELADDADRRREAEEWLATRQFNADLDSLQELIAQEKLTQDLLRKRALEELTDERLEFYSASIGRDVSNQQGQQSDSNTVRRRMTISEAECIAEREFKRLRLIDNQSEWARVLGCGRKMVKKLLTWQKAEEYRRDYRNGLRKKLHRNASQEMLAALSGDKSVIASLSDEDRDQWDKMSDEDRAKLHNILKEDEE